LFINGAGRPPALHGRELEDAPTTLQEPQQRKHVSFSVYDPGGRHGKVNFEAMSLRPGNIRRIRKAILAYAPPSPYPVVSRALGITMTESAETLQARYYEQSALAYDSMHNASEDHEHNLALQYMDMISNAFGLQTFLDVGAGTGRGICFLRSRGKEVRGIEPVAAMIEQAELNGLPKGLLVQGSGYDLPFEDEAFDAVFACGVLHHVAQPERMVAEMIRVARRAVFLSDANRFGQGSHSARLLKLALYKCGLWRAARYLQTKGKMYTISEGDGLAYSYSVFDSYQQLAVKTKQIWLLPTAAERSTRSSWLHPLLTSTHVLLCGFKGTPGKAGPSLHLKED
jgi:ubiquinone/menaquinone biosynthesis C-methylase UbiE